MLDWFYEHETLTWWLIGGSVVTFFVSLIVVPLILIRLPSDYFCQPQRHRIPWATQHPLLRMLLLVLKNTLAVFFILAGIIMIALPGQGILTILIGLSLLDFPGKYQLERRLVEQHSVNRAINWIRKKAGKPELILKENS